MKHIKFIVTGILLISSVTSCKKFIEIDPPRTELIKSTVFSSDATANAAMTDIYYNMQIGGFASGTPHQSITSLASYSSDETINYSIFVPSSQQFNENELQIDNIYVFQLWSQMYSTIYKVNAIIEGVANSTEVSDNLKKQLEGEAKFIRAFCHFYLVNLYGDVPIITKTDYKTNAIQTKASFADVYQQIILDLKEAQNLLPDNYGLAGDLRVRAKKGAATALLARSYLYTQDWVNAEIESSKIIDNSSVYGLESDLTQVFRTSSKEAIFQLWSDVSWPNDRASFFVSSSGPRNGGLRPEFASSFDAADQRWITWGQTRVVSGITYYGILKYFDFSVPPLDYTTVLRVAEQYLIRAEARAKQNNLVGLNSAESDINIIRNRAALPNTNATTQADLLLAIENERKCELFGEWGHRWLDLKRTDRANAVIGPLKPGWQPTDVLYPIPDYEIRNSSLTQNPGYQ